jgi:uncharacterized membrane protein YfcA
VVLESWQIAGSLLVGLFIGFLSGLFGVGGAFLLVPLLYAGIGIDKTVAVVAGYCQMLAATSSALKRYARRAPLNMRLAAVMCGGSFSGVIVGAWIHQRLKGLDDRLLGLVMDVLYVVLLCSVIGLIANEVVRRRRVRRGARRSRVPAQPRGLLAGLRLGPSIPVGPGGLRKVPVVAAAYVTLCVGILTGMLGIGGGVLLFPILVYVVGSETREAIGVSLLVIAPSAMIGIASYTAGIAAGGTLAALVVVAAALVLGAGAGAQLGAMANLRLPTYRIRGLFALVVTGALVLVVWHLVGLVA